MDDLSLNLDCNISKDKESCLLYFSTYDFHTHKPLRFNPAFLLLLLSQALIIESQVKITSSSHTWLGQKQLLQRSNVFFLHGSSHWLGNVLSWENALDSKWQSFALNKERGALGTLPAWIVLELEGNHTVRWVSFAVCYSQHTCDSNMFHQLFCITYNRKTLSFLSL